MTMTAREILEKAADLVKEISETHPCAIAAIVIASRGDIDEPETQAAWSAFKREIECSTSGAAFRYSDEHSREEVATALRNSKRFLPSDEATA